MILKSLLLISLLLFSLDSFGEDDKLVEVPIGNKRTEIRAILKSDLEKRITTLEKAVNQLQEKLSKLETRTPTEVFVVCTLTTAFNAQFKGRHIDIVESTKQALNNCLKANDNNGSICPRNSIVCNK